MAGTSQPTVKAANGAQTQGQPTTRTFKLPMDTRPMVAGAELQDVDFGFDESGQLGLVFKNGKDATKLQNTQPDDFDLGDNPPADNDDGQGNVNPVSTQSSDPRIDKLEQGLTAVTGQLTSLGQMLQALVASSGRDTTSGEGNVSTGRSDQRQETFDLADPNGLASFVESVVSRAISGALEPIRTEQGNIGRRMEMANVVATYGQDVTKQIPEIAKLMAGDSSLSIENAYLIIRGRQAAQGRQQPTATDGTSRTTNPKQQTVRRMPDAETGVSVGVEDEQGEASSLEEALEMAIGAVRRGRRG